MASPTCGTPLHDAAAPREARAERAQQDAMAGLQPALALGRRERDRERRGRRVPERLDAIDDTIGRKAEALADRPGDPRVRLVIGEQVDVLELEARRLDGLQRHL